MSDSLHHLAGYAGPISAGVGIARGLWNGNPVAVTGGVGRLVGGLTAGPLGSVAGGYAGEYAGTYLVNPPPSVAPSLSR